MGRWIKRLVAGALFASVGVACREAGTPAAPPASGAANDGGSRVVVGRGIRVGGGEEDERKRPPTDAGSPNRFGIDGRIDPLEWAGVPTFKNPVLPGPPFANDRLISLRAVRQNGFLYVGIEGFITPGNAMVLFLARNINANDGLPLSARPIDFATNFDRALSNEQLTVLDPTRQFHFAWGTLEMARWSSGPDPRIGWRDFISRPGEYVPLGDFDTPSVCSQTACETAVPLDRLGIQPDFLVEAFVRIVSPNAIVSDQALPPDLGPLVSEFATITTRD